MVFVHVPILSIAVYRQEYNGGLSLEFVIRVLPIVNLSHADVHVLAI